MTQDFEAKSGDVVLPVETRKGAFLLSSQASRRSWTVSEAHFEGNDIFHVAYALSVPYYISSHPRPHIPEEKPT